MTETREITAADAGTWLDGYWGWHNGYRAVQHAMEHGYVLPEEIRAQWDAFMSTEPLDHNAWTDINGDDGWLVTEATEYLNEHAPDGYEFVWDAGELSLMSSADADEFGHHG